MAKGQSGSGAASDLCLVPFQDLLGTREQVNVPGSVNEHNWTYRTAMDVDALCADQATCDRLVRLSVESRRFDTTGGMGRSPPTSRRDTAG